MESRSPGPSSASHIGGVTTWHLAGQQARAGSVISRACVLLAVTLARHLRTSNCPSDGGNDRG
jgi:hypothetical protein